MKWTMENGKWTTDKGQESMDNEEIQSSLECYLNGEQPILPEIIELPTNDELDAAEAEFDRIIAERKPQRHSLLHWWPLVTVAAVLALTFIVVKQLDSLDSHTKDSPSELVQREQSVLSWHPIREGAGTIDESNPSSSQTVLANSQEEDPNAELTVSTIQSARSEFLEEDPANESRNEAGTQSKETVPSLVREGVESSVGESSSSPGSLSYYLTRLEAEMQAVDDSVAREHLEQLIATDVHLQQLVQRIVHAEVETAMNTAPTDSTAGYLNF